MRVGIEVSPLTVQRTGVGNYTYYLLKHLLAEAGDIRFAGFSSGLQPIELPEGAGLEYHRHIAVPTRILYRAWSLLGRPRVDQLLGGVEVYHATNYVLPPVRSARRVLTLYDLSFLRMPERCSPRIVGPFARGVRRFAHEADALLTCSEAAKQDIVTLAGVDAAKVTVVYGAVEPEFQPVDRAMAVDWLERHYGIQPPFLLFVGTLEARKNILGLVEAFSRLAAEIPHTLVLAGGMGWGMEGLDAAIARHGLEARVIRTGYIRARADLPKFYSAAGLFVFPSYYEGFGLPVLEAMACGCPVLCAQTSSLPEVGGSAARYMNPDDPGDMAAQLRAVLSDDGLRGRMREAGLVQARAFSWEDCARRTLEVYRSLA